MSRISLTLRIDAAESAALKNLSQIEGRPINQLLNEAVKNYLSRKGQKERGWEATLEGLRKYRAQKEVAAERAIAAVVEAEVSLPDPLEGELLEGEFVGGKFKPAKPAQRKLRRVAGA
jgi:hypothetical protein